MRPRPPKIVEKICLFENIFPSDAIHTHPPWWNFLVLFSLTISLGKTRPGKSRNRPQAENSEFYNFLKIA